MEKGGWICSTVPWDSYDIDEHYNVQSCDPMRMFGIHAKAMHASYPVTTLPCYELIPKSVSSPGI
jgi:hypothetical protein